MGAFRNTEARLRRENVDSSGRMISSASHPWKIAPAHRKSIVGGTNSQ
jgi:hypothetical protein